MVLDRIETQPVGASETCSASPLNHVAHVARQLHHILVLIRVLCCKATR